ncbi:MAG TPA: D-alanyl-D-alanine carboxypeptidase/D-alanyl-D-alanine-endopeptidase [Rhodothermales bacterium]|nr:D-alanyl-D-alanine carboxypeptidase/D-alanyl-D-alanine-endopeptidase [Bacteroidota bacterium]HRK73934.1 D-alanyl-D-alanine carboxypeptidase/D-alanyl-D-alanine-endopeptidase [Rhodothermales bacterium]HRR08624.1 D-alanyl-D-alanine carboxypeptidase/D-alanyl-D-alanine-endopeptidase [Rhodothermales bacterium]
MNLHRLLLPIVFALSVVFLQEVRAQEEPDSTEVDIPEPPETKSPKSLGEQISDYLSRYSAGAIWGIKVMDLTNGEVLYERNPERPLTPASNMKLYTTAAALDLLGPDFRYETDLYYKGKIEGETLRGDLYIRGSGDPSLGGLFDDEQNDLLRVFHEWSEALKRMGIRNVEGNVIGDDDIFDDFARAEEWESRDFNNCYAAEVSGLSFTENCVEFTVEGNRPGQKATVTLRPGNTEYVQMVNKTATTSGRGVSGGVGRPYHTNNMTFTVKVGSGRSYTNTMPITNPTLFTAQVFKETLQNTGIQIWGRAVDVDSLAEKPSYRGYEMRRVGTAVSPPMAEIAAVINKRSHNMYAEHVLKTLGTTTSWDGVPRPGSTVRGGRAIRDFLRKIGARTDDIILSDGSGLSRGNKITAAATVRLLEYMYQHPNIQTRQAFYNSLSVAGVDGTLRKRMKEYPTMGNVRAKTGYINGVRSLSGYVTTVMGTPIAFALIANQYNTSTGYVTRVQDSIVKLIARYQH